MKKLCGALILSILFFVNLSGQSEVFELKSEYMDYFPDTVCIDTELEFSIDKKNIRDVEVSLMPVSNIGSNKRNNRGFSLTKQTSVIKIADLLSNSKDCNRSYILRFKFNKRRTIFSFLRGKKSYTQSKKIYVACCDIPDGLISCKENLVKYPDFLKGEELLENPWFKAIGNPRVSSNMGYLDKGYGVITGNNNRTDALSTFCAFQKEKIYKVRLAIRSSGKQKELDSGYKLRVYASNDVRFSGSNHPELDENTHLIGVVSLDNSTIWTEVALSTWKSPKQFKFIIFSISSDSLSEKLSKAVFHIDNICVSQVEKHDDCFSLELDEQGNYELDDNYNTTGLSASSKEEELIEYDRGAVNDIYEYVDDIYESFDELLDDNCFSVGGYVPAEYANWTIEDEFEKEGLKKAEFDDWTKSITFPIPVDPITILDPIDEVLIPCEEEFELQRGEPFQGRDIIFIHGLMPEHIVENLKGNSDFQQVWPDDVSAFTSGGDYHKAAVSYWSGHIKNYVSKTNNRYLIIPFNSSQNLETAVHTVLTFIREAMENGTGVVANGHPQDTMCFGKDAVIISHSTGGLVANVALSLAHQSGVPNSAARNTYGDMSAFPDNIRAHIALAGAFTGSDYAELAVSAANALNPLIPVYNWVNQWLGLNLQSFPQNHLANTINNSILVDLAPRNTQTFWSDELSFVTVPTLLVTGGHPSRLTPLKHIFHKGYDDGVLTTDCQCANTNGPYYKHGLVTKTFDLGIPLARAGLYHIDHVMQYGLGKASTGCFPYYSSTGMLQNVKSIPNPIQRYPNYYPVMESTTDHMNGHIAESDVQTSKTYIRTLNKVNNEETMLAHHPLLYQSISGTRLVSTDFSDLNHEFIKKKVLKITIKYPKKIKIKVKLWKPKVTIEIEWGRWIFEILLWKRTYHRLRDFEDENMLDYVYDYLLSDA